MLIKFRFISPNCSCINPLLFIYVEIEERKIIFIILRIDSIHFISNIVIIYQKLFPSPLNVFSFHHPKAQITSTLHQKISGSSTKKLMLQDIQCKLHFISSADEIGKLLVAFPPKVSIRDARDNAKICLAQAVLDVRHLFSRSQVRKKNFQLFKQNYFPACIQLALIFKI